MIIENSLSHREVTKLKFFSIFASVINIKDESVQQSWASQDSSQRSPHVLPAKMVQSHEHEFLAVFNTCHFISDTWSLITNTCYLSVWQDGCVGEN